MSEMRRSDRVRIGPSAIHERGVFACEPIAAGAIIGELELGPAGEQGRHTLLVGTEHRLVAAPWRFLNHACAPTALLHVGERDAVLCAACDLAPETELTIDYTKLREKLGTPFRCHCPRCSAAGESSRIGE